MRSCFPMNSCKSLIRVKFCHQPSGYPKLLIGRSVLANVPVSVAGLLLGGGWPVLSDCVGWLPGGVVTVIKSQLDNFATPIGQLCFSLSFHHFPLVWNDPGQFLQQ